MNNGVITKVLIFATGAAIGSAVTWKLLKTKYEQLANEEIESVKEVFSKNKQADDSKEDDGDPVIARHYEKIIADYAVEKEEKNQEKEEKGESKNMGHDRPYTISPNEFAELEDYEVCTLLYFQDEVLTDDDNNVIDDPDDIVGLTSLESFGEYEEDSVYVRNDKLKCDYEILRDYRNYSDVVPNSSDE